MKEGTRKKTSTRSTKKVSVKHTVAFEYYGPDATSVTLVGEFNGWDPEARPLKRDPGGMWKATVRLEPGSYQYKFVVDGQRWEEDPVNLLRVHNQHGTYNSVRNVGAQERAAQEAEPTRG